MAAAASMPHPGVAILLLEYFRDGPATIAGTRRGVVHLVWVRPAHGIGMAVSGVGATAAIVVVPPGFHAAIALAKVGVRAVTRPYMHRDNVQPGRRERWSALLNAIASRVMS